MSALAFVMAWVMALRGACVCVRASVGAFWRRGAGAVLARVDRVARLRALATFVFGAPSCARSGAGPTAAAEWALPSIALWGMALCARRELGRAFARWRCA